MRSLHLALTVGALGAVLVLTACGGPRSAHPVVPAPTHSSSRGIDPAVEPELARELERTGAPGLVVVVTRGDDVLTRAYGRDGTGAPMTSATPLRVASLTKTITAVAVLQQIEAGRLRPDDTVVTHLPEFAMADPRHAAITVQQLLDHTSGLRDVSLDLADLNRRSSLAAYVAGLAHARLATAPGGAYAYCNANYEVLARLVEVVTGRPFARYVAGEVFAPLGMRASTVDVADTVTPDGFQELYGFWFPRHDRQLFAASSGANGWVTTAADLGRWTRWLATGRGGAVLRPETRRTLMSRAPGSTHAYGNGLQAFADGTVGHTGLQFTDRARIAVRPADEVGVAVYANTGGLVDPTDATSAAAFAALDGRPAPSRGLSARGLGLALAAVSVLAALAAVRGTRRARHWAEVRNGRRAVGTAGRLVGLAAPIPLLLGVPALVRLLTNGTRTLTWSQATYLLLTPLVTLGLVASAGLVVLVARVGFLVAQHRDRRRGVEQLGGGEAEDGTDRVAQMRG